MANMLYGGVEFPAIPVVEGCPHALISKIPDAAVESLGYEFYLILTASPFEPSSTGNFAADGLYQTYRFINGAWVQEDTNGDEDISVMPSMGETLVWTNTDILNSDGSVYLAASMPVPMNGMPMVLFSNSVSVSYLSAVGAFVSDPLSGLGSLSVGDTVCVVIDGVAYTDTVSTIPSFGGIPGFGSVGLSFSDRPYVFGKTDLGAGEHWYMVTTTADSHRVRILSMTGTSNVNVIAWDGDTTGLLHPEGILYKVSSDAPTEEQILGGLLAHSTQPGAVSTITSDLITRLDDNSYAIAMIVVVYERDTTVSSGAFYEKGIYFQKGVEGNNAEMLVYLASAGADLRPVYLRENGKWVKKEAYEIQNGKWVLISSAEESGVYDDTWPIEWNSLAVQGNPQLIYEGASAPGWIKISNLTPTADELTGSVFSCQYEWEGQTWRDDFVFTQAVNNSLNHLIAEYRNEEYVAAMMFLIVPDASSGYEPGLYMWPMIYDEDLTTIDFLYQFILTKGV